MSRELGSPDAPARERGESRRVVSAIVGSTTAHLVALACLLAIVGAEVDSAVIVDLRGDGVEDRVEPPAWGANGSAAGARVGGAATGDGAMRPAAARPPALGQGRPSPRTAPTPAPLTSAGEQSASIAQGGSQPRPTNSSIASRPPVSNRRMESPPDAVPGTRPDPPVTAVAPPSSPRANRPESAVDANASSTSELRAAASDAVRPAEPAARADATANAPAPGEPTRSSPSEGTAAASPASGTIAREGSPSAAAPSRSGEGTGGAGERGGVAGGGAGRSVVDAGSGTAGGGPLALAVPGTGGPAAPEYAAYLARFRRRVQEALVYPPLARRRGLTGSVEVEVLIEPAGTVVAAHVITSSSHAVLDAAALDAIRSMPPVPMPDHLPRRALRVRLPLSFLLQ